ncbi:hypothetical protein BJ508DRAFT_329312 [Ascobolus immersus RN42]|uniref:F-box domain-containing protein n=1 Tax=Ascobolus immersus RN42 TaxID=1160509 RepID=A0A3N4I2N7_ASCIM|nr:hypothetical protein BJ508DRAFT_329312 [Ascobolus immersus RN42]
MSFSAPATADTTFVMPSRSPQPLKSNKRRRRQPPKVPKPANPLHFLRLPLEIRLCIFRLLPAYSLLQLSHSHPQLLGEVHAHPSIYKSAYGYSDFPTNSVFRKAKDTFHPFSLSHVMKLIDDSEFVLSWDQNRKSQAERRSRYRYCLYCRRNGVGWGISVGVGETVECRDCWCVSRGLYEGCLRERELAKGGRGGL